MMYGTVNRMDAYELSYFKITLINGWCVGGKLLSYLYLSYLI